MEFQLSDEHRMIKDLVRRVVDDELMPLELAMQCFGAMGVIREWPPHLVAARLRPMRIFDGPTEGHKWAVARNLLGSKR